MNPRQIDLALLAGIGVLLLVILMLALSTAPLSAAGDISDPVDAVGVVPTERDEAVVPSTGDALNTEAPAEAATEAAEPAGAASPATAPGAAQPVAPAAAENAEATFGAPAGSVSLGRIGFAYATGAVGACGVPLTAWEYVAVSRDLLERYPCGTAVTLTLEDATAGRSEVVAQVGDTMGADISDTVNIFVGQDEPALEYGVTSGTLSP